MMTRSPGILVAIAVLLVLCNGAVQAQSEAWEVGLRPAVLLGDGVPSNDMLGVGLALRFERSKDWTLGFGLDQFQFDFEEPNRQLGIVLPPGTKPIDSKVDSTVVSAWLERRYGSWLLPLAGATPCWYRQPSHLPFAYQSGRWSGTTPAKKGMTVSPSPLQHAELVLIGRSSRTLSRSCAIRMSGSCL